MRHQNANDFWESVHSTTLRHKLEERTFMMQRERGQRFVESSLETIDVLLEVNGKFAQKCVC